MDKHNNSNIRFCQHGDDRGRMVVIEGGIDIPFEIKRVFYIFGTKDHVVRGKHANRRTQFVLINVSGTSKVKLDTGFEQQIITLDHPHMGVYIPAMVWKDMYDFSQDSVLLALASEHYDSEEYIRDYDDFIKEVKNKNA